MISAMAHNYNWAETLVRPLFLFLAIYRERKILTNQPKIIAKEKKKKKKKLKKKKKKKTKKKTKKKKKKKYKNKNNKKKKNNKIKLI